MVSEVVKSLVENPGVLEAKRLVAKLKERGFLVYSNPASGVSIVGQSDNNVPCSADMESVYALHHEISLLFAIQALGKHYQSIALAGRVLNEIRQDARKL